MTHVGGGAIADVATNATAFPHRGVVVVLQVKAIWNDAEDPEVERANVAWVDGVASSIRNNVTGAYVNYIDGRLDDWPRAYYGDNLPRLSAVKRAVDPESFFKFKQSIPPSSVGLYSFKT